MPDIHVEGLVLRAEGVIEAHDRGEVPCEVQPGAAAHLPVSKRDVLVGVEDAAIIEERHGHELDILLEHREETTEPP